ncbi:MAG: OmpA family protein [Deltaproteobacteria bacterium]|jgi:chemotaxis protein MotB|nr:OmpA family protein [Deltaproteobacteria bacterium]
MPAEKKTPIIKKIIKKGHGGHHGGSWKVAYADFVTAMMAFFLVMWLLAISSEQGKAALADYFSNLTMRDAVFNGGVPSAFDASNPSPGILEGGCFDMIKMGKSLEEREKILAEREMAVEAAGDDREELGATRPTDAPQDPNLTELPEGVEGGEGSDQQGVAPGEGLYAEGFGTPGGALTDDEAAAERAKQALAEEIKTQVTAGLGGNLDGQFSVEMVPGGVKIQLMDKEKRPLFVSGQPRLTPVAQEILQTVAQRLKTIPNKISIEGHTDAVATASQELTNWELSTARASAARRYISRQGIGDDRLTMVAGFASTQPLPDTNPMDPINRRVSIMIWDENASLKGARPGAPPAGPVSPTLAPTAPPPPSAGEPPRATRPAPTPTRPRPEDLEHQLLEETLTRAASPDASTAGPPVPPTPAPEDAGP